MKRRLPQEEKEPERELSKKVSVKHKSWIGKPKFKEH